jgi:hypothetical protein
VRERHPSTPARRLLLAFAGACLLLAACTGQPATPGTTGPGAPAVSATSVDSSSPAAPGEAPSTAGPPTSPTDEPPPSPAVDVDDGAAAADPGSTDAVPSPAASVDPSAPAAGRLPGEPDPALTPGAFNPDVTQATIGSTICVPGWTATIRPPSSYTTALKVEQITEYGYADTSTGSYEEDHLISLELGGAPTDPMNLWPEPYSASLLDGRPVGAHVKDGYETTLKHEVCAGTVTLDAARADIGTHWVHAYYGIPIDVGSTPTPPPPVTPTPATPNPTVTTPSPRPTAKSTGPGRLTVAFVSLSTPTTQGATATASVQTRPGAACAIRVVYRSGPSKAAGLGPETASSSGLASWRWTIGSRTTHGAWPVTVTCSAGGASASATRSLVVQ